MIVAFKKNNLISGVRSVYEVDSEYPFLGGIHLKNIIKAYLDGTSLEVACSLEIMKKEYSHHIYFNKITNDDFIENYAHELNYIKLYSASEFDEDIGIKTLNAICYVLFDLDNNTILTPDYDARKNNMMHLRQTKELNSMFDMYRYMYQHFLNDFNYKKFALDNKAFVIESKIAPFTRYGKNDDVISYGVKLRPFEVNSQSFMMKYNQCCCQFTAIDIDCGCGDEVKDKMLAPLPF